MVDVLGNDSNAFDLIYGLVGQQSFLVINMNIAAALGLNEALVYSSMLDKYKYYREHDLLKNINGKEYFYSTEEDLQRSTTLSRKKQDAAIDALIKAGLLEKILLETPPKRHFHLLLNSKGLNLIMGIMETGVQIKLSKTDKLNCPKRTTNNTIYNNTKEKDICASHEKTKKEFVPPTVEEVQAYINEQVAKGKKDYIGISATHFVDYYEADDWHYGDNRKKVKCWKRCLSTWASRGYNTAPTKQQPTKLPGTWGKVL